VPETRLEFGVLLQRIRVDAKLTQEELAAQSKISVRTISDLERGKARFPHAGTAQRLADALGLGGPDREAFLAAARGRGVIAPTAPAREPGRPLPESVKHVYRLRHGYAADGSRRIGIITGDIRRVRHVDIWVNSENTDMRMSRFEEYTISAIVRYDGAVRDAAGHVIEDSIADELARNVEGRCPVAAGTTIMTGPGQLAISNNVRAIAHVASVYGEPGVGYRQIGDVGRCVISVLTEVDRTGADKRSFTVLFPMLGTGQGRGNITETAVVLVGAAADYLIDTPETMLTTVWFLAHTSNELAAFQNALTISARFVKAET
jgi:transcriptional regulator with XRE-family HTH domain